VTRVVGIEGRPEGADTAAVGAPGGGGGGGSAAEPSAGGAAPVTARVAASMERPKGVDAAKPLSSANFASASLLREAT
jgi:hypothetical protein